MINEQKFLEQLKEEAIAFQKSRQHNGLNLEIIEEQVTQSSKDQTSKL